MDLLSLSGRWTYILPCSRFMAYEYSAVVHNHDCLYKAVLVFMPLSSLNCTQDRDILRTCLTVLENDERGEKACQGNCLPSSPLGSSLQLTFHVYFSPPTFNDSSRLHQYKCRSNERSGKRETREGDWQALVEFIPVDGA